MIVIDGFIKNKKVLDVFKSEDTWKGFPVYNWWDGWWNIKPRNIMETIIHTAWQNIPQIDKAAGFEYWSNVHHENQSLGWHRDRDEQLFDSSNVLKTTTAGHVYYVTCENLEGGFLEIENNERFDKIQYTDVERLKPVENRLIMFNPTLNHRVSKITKGKRRAFLANAWSEKPSTFKNGDNVNKNFEPVDWTNKNKVLEL